MIGIVNIDYHEGYQDTYRGINIKIQTGTGNPVADWQSIKRLAALAEREGFILTVLLASSCDHFVVDGDAYAFNSEGDLVYLPSEGHQGL